MSFPRRWALANTAAMVAAFLVYTPIAHGITGAHGSDLTAAQFAAHTAALIVVGIAVGLAQRSVLSRWRLDSGARVLAAAALFPVAFWIGYYQPWVVGPDVDILLGFLVLGCASWVGRIPARKHPLAALAALLSFPLAAFLGEVVFLLAILGSGVTPDPHNNALQHSAFWITVGAVAGLAGGWTGGLALRRMGNLVPEDAGA